jgi:hypothetical protein
MVSQCSESRVQFRFYCRTDDKQLSSEHFRRVLHVLDVVGHIRIGRVHQKSHGHGVGRGFMQHLKLLSRDCAHEKSNARDVALRPIHAGNQTEFDGIAPRRREDDRNRRSCRLGGKRGGGPPAVAITLTLRRTRSAANSCSRLTSSSAHRYSIATFRFSTKPASASPFRNADRRGLNAPGDESPRKPISGIASCCARDAAGHPAAVQHNKPRRSRRLMMYLVIPP